MAEKRGSEQLACLQIITGVKNYDLRKGYGDSTFRAVNHPWRIVLVLLTLVGLLACQAHCASDEGDHKGDAVAHCDVHCVCQVLPEVTASIVVAPPLQPETTQMIPVKELVSSQVVRPLFQPPRA